jgi:hypothetical protein
MHALFGKRRSVVGGRRSPALSRVEGVVGRRRSVVGGRWSAVGLVLVVALLVLVACGVSPAEEVPQATEGGGGISPEAVTLSFFEDLRRALQAPDLANDEVREGWVERLASYFAPNERDDQRVALSDALAGLVAGRGQLQPNEAMTFELRFDRDRAEKLSDDGQRAVVRLVNPSLYILITRTTDSGTVVVYEDEVALHQLIGNADGAIPTVKIGRDWYITEGQVGGG